VAEHRIAGSAITTQGFRRNVEVTLTCSCGTMVTGRSKKRAIAERRAELKYMLHKKGR
jgi:hypothetical protein